MGIPQGTQMNTASAANVSSKPKRYVVTEVIGNAVVIVPTAGKKEPKKVSKKWLTQELNKGTIIIKDLSPSADGTYRAPKYDNVQQNLTKDRSKYIYGKVQEAVVVAVDTMLKSNAIAKEIHYKYSKTGKKGAVEGYTLQYYDVRSNMVIEQYCDKDTLKKMFDEGKITNILNLTYGANGAFNSNNTFNKTHTNGEYTLSNYRAYILSTLKNDTSIKEVIEEASLLSASPTVKIIPHTSKKEERERVVQNALDNHICLMIQQNPNNGIIKAYVGTKKLSTLVNAGFEPSTFAVHVLAKKYLSCSFHNKEGKPYPPKTPHQYNAGTYQKLLSCALRPRVSRDKTPIFELSTTNYGTYIDTLTAMITLDYCKDAQNEWNKILQNNYCAEGTISTVIDGNSVNVDCHVSSKLVTYLKQAIDSKTKTIEEIATYLSSGIAKIELWDACVKASRAGGGILLVSNMNDYEKQEFADTVDWLAHLYKNNGYK